MLRLMIILGDCLQELGKFPDKHFSAASFSPPYGVGSSCGFDVRKDFNSDGKFLPFAREISRTCLIWAINLTQRINSGKNLPFLEEFVLALDKEGIEIWDRWVVVKPSGLPCRGERPMTTFEFILLFSQYPKEIKKHVNGNTVLLVRRHHQSVQSANQFTPYFEEIPRQVFAMYGGPSPVLDPFAGSGTSLLEAKKLGLGSYGIEKDPDVFRQLAKRMGEET